MLAVIKTGGKQYKVGVGQTIRVESIGSEVGEKVVLNDVLMVVDSEEKAIIGNPRVKGASVTGKVVSHGKFDKVRIFKLLRRKNSKKQQGHRQGYTEIEISEISTK